MRFFAAVDDYLRSIGDALICDGEQNGAEAASASASDAELLSMPVASTDTDELYVCAAERVEVSYWENMIPSAAIEETVANDIAHEEVVLVVGTPQDATPRRKPATIVAWFLNTCALNEQKEADLCEQMDATDWDFIGIAGTRRTQNQEFERGKGHMFFGSANDAPKRGVALLVQEKCVRFVKKPKPVSERILWVDFRFGATHLRVIIVYLPTTAYGEAHVDEMYMHLSQIISEARHSGSLVMVLGDFNAVVGQRQCDEEAGWHGGHTLPQARNHRGDSLATSISQKNMRLANTCFRKPEGKLIMHVRGKSKRVIDYIAVSKYTMLSVQSERMLSEMILVTDHRALKMTARISGLKKMRRGKSVSQKMQTFLKDGPLAARTSASIWSSTIGTILLLPVKLSSVLQAAHGRPGMSHLNHKRRRRRTAATTAER